MKQLMKRKEQDLEMHEIEKLLSEEVITSHLEKVSPEAWNNILSFMSLSDMGKLASADHQLNKDVKDYVVTGHQCLGTQKSASLDPDVFALDMMELTEEEQKEKSEIAAFEKALCRKIKRYEEISVLGEELYELGSLRNYLILSQVPDVSNAHPIMYNNVPPKLDGNKNCENFIIEKTSCIWPALFVLLMILAAKEKDKTIRMSAVGMGVFAAMVPLMFLIYMAKIKPCLQEKEREQFLQELQTKIDKVNADAAELFENPKLRDEFIVSQLKLG